MMDIKQEIEVVFKEKEFFVLMLLKKIIEKLNNIYMLIISNINKIPRSVEFSVSASKFSVFENKVRGVEFSILSPKFSEKSII